MKEKVVVLGTAAAVTDGTRDNVSLVFSAGEFTLLLECGGSAAHKLAKIGIPYETLEHILITHIHVDHLYGLPGLLVSMKYRDLTRTTPLRLYCPQRSQPTIRGLLDVFGMREKSNFPLQICGIPSAENALLLENEQVVVTTTPVDHAPDVPTLAVRIHSRVSGKTLVYSSDTTLSERLIRLAQQADLFFHECAGLTGQPIPEIHSTARQVGEVARRSHAQKVVLLHLNTLLRNEPAALVAEVKQEFAGEVRVASDFDEYVLSRNQ